MERYSYKPTLPSPSPQTPLPTAAASQRSDRSQQSPPWSLTSASGRVGLQSVSYYDQRCVQTAPPGTTHHESASR
ncbi:hypothetical protein CLOM_g13627 [Closterium sp. NIES-68]|nr:hypothetical protein CLOM_g13627 [Closterium sp. NIES-68]